MGADEGVVKLLCLEMELARRSYHAKEFREGVREGVPNTDGLPRN